MIEEKTRPRCRWCNLANPLYVRYHDEEWGVPCHDDHALYELLILESFQAGLSWETVLRGSDSGRSMTVLTWTRSAPTARKRSPNCSLTRASSATG